MQSDSDQEIDHWKWFPEFCRQEMEVGGPDPQFAMIGEAAKGLSPEEGLWIAGCYCAFHSFAPAEIFWTEWPWPSILEAPAERVEAWTRKHWAGLTMRTERRTVRSPERLTKYFMSYARWLNDTALGLQHTDYETVWTASIKEIDHYGRYMALKLLELYSKYFGFRTSAPDLRPKDAWSPRRTLALLSPHGQDITDGSVDFVNEAAADVKHRLLELGVGISWYDFQVLLCEYRESWQVGRFYPGRSHDEQLEGYVKIRDHWPDHTWQMFPLRKKLFKPEVLGELNGWDGVRKELGKALPLYGFLWNDLRYKYHETKDLSEPVAQ